MFYHFLLQFADIFSPLNVLQYITFRSIYAFLTSLIFTIILGPFFISWLKKLKLGQYIKDCGPAHQLKEGTPTMGGLLIGAAVITSVLLWGRLDNSYLLLCLFVYIGFGFVGFLDDYLKIKRRNNAGISGKSKLFGQVLVASCAMGFLIFFDPSYSTTLSIPFFKNITPDLGWLYLFFAIFVIVGTSNAVNLTDGLDGLAIGPSTICISCLALFIYFAGHQQIASYLQITYIPNLSEVTVFCAALIGAGLGFLWFNAYPAQIFMGDVGSLSIGGVMGFIAVLAKQELILPIAGGVFVFETISVILQVSYFKMSGGKRIFRMAPLHHHFELKGVPESKIIIRFWIFSILLALVALSTLKLR